MKKARQNILEMTGTVIRYTANRHNDVDGIIVCQQDTLVEVKFPPHTARYVLDIAAAGEEVKVISYDKPHPPHAGHKHPTSKRHLKTIENTGNHKQVDVDSIKAPHPPETGRAETFTIPNPHYTRHAKDGNNGPIIGVIFEDRFIHLHPDEYQEGEEGLESATVLTVKAKKRTPEAGFVNADGYAVYHAHSVSAGL